MIDPRVIVFAVVAAASGWVGPVRADAAPSSVQIRSAETGLCVEIAGGSRASGAEAVQADCVPGARQAWTVKPLGAGASQLVSEATGLCLAAKGGSAVQQACSAAESQRWSVVGSGGATELRPLGSNQCLESGDEESEPGAALGQTACAGVGRQKWALTSVDGRGGLLVGRRSGKCVQPVAGKLVQTTCFDRPDLNWDIVAATGGSRVINRQTKLCASVVGGADDAPIVQATCGKPGAGDVWTLRPTDDDGYEFVSAAGKCMTVRYSSIEEGAELLQWTCTGEESQRWRVSSPGGPSLWGAKITLPLTPVAAATLRNGKVLTWSAYDRFAWGGDQGKTYTSLFDPATGKVSAKLVSNTGHDMFCPGTSMLADGRILVTGGSSASKASIYDPKTNKWTATGELNVARGYNGDTALSTGEALTIGGSWSGGHYGKLGEVWNPKTGAWRKLEGVPSEALSASDPLGDFLGDQHMWLFGTADGYAFHAGPSAEMHWIDTAGDGRIVAAGPRGDDAYSQNGNVVMYEAGKLLKVGGAPSYQVAVATTSAYTIDFSRGPGKPVKVAKQTPMAFPRAFGNSVVLPTGEVVVVGGQAFPITFTDTYAAMLPEIWSPKTGAFTRLAALSTPRTYHSVALLLTDGRVLAGGGGLCGADCAENHPDVEILTPPYLLKADGSPAKRPEIVKAPKTATWGETIEVEAEGKPKSFALVRLNAATHSVNNDQRRLSVKLLSSKAGVHRLKLSKDRGMLLPGDWMLFAMTAKGVPSVAKIIRVQ